MLNIQEINKEFQETAKVLAKGLPLINTYNFYKLSAEIPYISIKELNNRAPTPENIKISLEELKSIYSSTLSPEHIEANAIKYLLDAYSKLSSLPDGDDNKFAIPNQFIYDWILFLYNLINIFTTNQRIINRSEKVKSVRQMIDLIVLILNSGVLVNSNTQAEKLELSRASDLIQKVKTSFEQI